VSAILPSCWNWSSASPNNFEIKSPLFPSVIADVEDGCAQFWQKKRRQTCRRLREIFNLLIW
jgi:hypothetical protein